MPSGIRRAWQCALQHVLMALLARSKRTARGPVFVSIRPAASLSVEVPLAPGTVAVGVARLACGVGRLGRPRSACIQITVRTE